MPILALGVCQWRPDVNVIPNVVDEIADIGPNLVVPSNDLGEDSGRYRRKRWINGNILLQMCGRQRWFHVLQTIAHCCRVCIAEPMCSTSKGDLLIASLAMRPIIAWMMSIGRVGQAPSNSRSESIAELV